MPQNIMALSNAAEIFIIRLPGAIEENLSDPGAVCSPVSRADPANQFERSIVQQIDEFNKTQAGVSGSGIQSS